MTAGRRLTPGLLAALGFITAVGPFAVDMYLPSFTQIGTELAAPASSVQLTLTAFLIGIGVGQLILGPLSDRFGRRPVLVIALAVFAASGVAMAFTPTVEVFIALRLVQGLTGAAGMMLARAIAVDLSEGETAVRALSLIAMLVGLGPLIAPPHRRRGRGDRRLARGARGARRDLGRNVRARRGGGAGVAAAREATRRRGGGCVRPLWHAAA